MFIEFEKYSPFFISVKWADYCPFLRRFGIVGKVIFGYSVVIMIFGLKIV